MKKPTFNHTRGDGPANPCPECRDLQFKNDRDPLAQLADAKDFLGLAVSRIESASALCNNTFVHARLAHAYHEVLDVVAAIERIERLNS